MTYNLSRIDLFTFILVLGIIIAATVAFWPLFSVFILSSSLAVVVLPIHRSLCRIARPAVAASLTALIVLFVLLAALIFSVEVLYANREYLVQIVSLILDWVRELRLEVIDSTVPPEQVASWLSDQFGQLGNYIGNIVRTIPFLIVQIIIFFLSLYMFIWRGDEIRTEIMDHLPSRIRSAIDEMTAVTVNTLYAVYVVHVATSVVTFILAVPFFALLGYDHVIFYSLLAAIFQLIPIIGPTLVMVFLGIYAVSIGDLRGLALIALIGYPVVCAFPDLYLRPLFMGQRAAIHPVLMWIGFFGGLAVMGIVGFVLGPLFIALVVSGYKILIRELKLAKEEHLYE
ncbi:MAG: AI-2E family transporter [Methanomicrobiaceae archaeon]|nr:AI-2E family transporter [Methanomicrobiaceae archaeon]